MYEQFFQLQSRPFAATPDPACFFRSDSIDEILSQLTVCVEHGQGIGILTAPAGMGKTLLCQRLAKDLSERYCCILLGNSNFPTRRSLLQAILLELGVEPSRKDEQELRHELRSALGEIHHDDQALVLIVDEAHLFEAAVLEEIRTLVDFAEEGQSLVRVILSGQLELEERMTDRQFDAINQRTSAHVYVEALSIAESVNYVRHRIEWAGGNPDEVLSDEGILIIARASCGVPRCLNQLADHSLLLGFAADESPVSESTVREALEDLKQLPLHWNDVNDADRMLESSSESSSTVEVDSLEAGTDETSLVEAATSAEVPSAIQVEAPQGTQQESQVELEPGESETAAPFAVFEFGGDDSPENEDDEGETLDEVASRIHLPSASSTDESIAESEQASAAGTAEADFGLSGRPSLPVSEICGVVLDLSSEVCGVSEYQGRAPKSAESDAVDETAQPGESAKEVQADDARTDDASANVTAVFEFGGPEDPTDPVSTAGESAEDAAEMTNAESEHEAELTDTRCDEAAPSEEEVLAEISSAENEIAEVNSEIADAESEDEAEETGTRSDEAAPTEEEVLAQIASVESEIAEVTAEFDLNSELNADADPVVVLDEDSQSTDSSEATAAAIDSELEEATAEEAAATANGTAAEFEVVSDPYSLIQEPLSAGIVWDVPAVTEEDRSQEIEETTKELCDVPETIGLSAESSAGGEISDGDVESSTDTSLEHTTEAAWIESEDAILEESGEHVSEELGEAIMRDWAEDTSESEDCSEPEDEQLDVVEAPTADLSLFEAEASDHSEQDASPGNADVEPIPAREIHPDRYIDAIVPMLGEIDDQFQAASQLADTPERPAGDIEAELVEAISEKDLEIEDEIGAAVLDMCLETQWNLQQDREESDEISDENSGQLPHSHLNLEPGRYDIVEPEESCSADSFLGQVSEISRGDSGESAASSERAPTRRPFGRLFSDLRRRGT